MKLERISLIVHGDNPNSAEVTAKIERWAESHGITISDDDPDLVLAAGGDGTMLRAAQVAHREDAPLLGINLGRLGYLPEVEVGGEDEALARVAAGDYQLEERMMLVCEDPDGTERVALNEVLVERSTRHRLVRLAVKISGEALASFSADGLILATPTGSTAYALSAGGPLVSPRTQCMVLVPVSAHMLFSHPLVLAPDDDVQITVDPGGEVASLALDGTAGWDIAPGESVTIGRHPRPLNFVRLSGPRFLERLRTKLDLPG